MLIRELRLQDCRSSAASQKATLIVYAIWDEIYLRGFQVKSCEIMSNAEWRRISIIALQAPASACIMMLFAKSELS